MPRFRIRGKLPSRQSIIVKQTADDPFQAVADARRELIAAGHNPALLTQLVVKQMEKAKSSVYVGAVPKAGGKRGRKPSSPNGIAVDPKSAPQAEAMAAAVDARQSAKSQPVAVKK